MDSTTRSWQDVELQVRDGEESFYGSTPNISSEIAGFETSSRPYLLKYGAPCRPDVIVGRSIANKKTHGDIFFITCMLPRVEQP